MAELLQNDANGLNKYHAAIAYQGAKIADLETLLNDHNLINQGSEEIFKVFSAKAANSNMNLNIVEMAFRIQKSNNLGYIKAIFNSKAFALLSSSEKAALLTEGGTSSILIQSIYSSTNYFDLIVNCLTAEDREAIFKNFQFAKLYIDQTMSNFKHFTFAFQNLSFDTIRDIMMSNYQFGSNLIEHLLKLQGNYQNQLQVILDHSFWQNCNQDDKKEILLSQKNHSLIKAIITLQGNHQSKLKMILESHIFKSLDYHTKKMLLTEGGNSSALSQAFHKSDNMRIIKTFLETTDNDIKQIIISHIQNIPQEKISQFVKLLLGYRDFQTLTDHEGFSALYYLKQKSLITSDLVQLKNSKFQEIVPELYKVEEHLHYTYYSSSNHSKTAMIYIGEDHNGANDSSAIHALLMKGYNVIAIDARTKKVSADDIYQVVAENTNNSRNIDLFVIEAHGNENEIKNGTHAITMHGSSIEKITQTESYIKKEFVKNSIETAKFLQSIAKAQENKPISVLLTSCKGQLVADEFNKLLPPNSEILTLGEYQTLHGKNYKLNTLSSNVQSLFSHLLERKDLNAENITLSKLATIYSNNLKGQSNIDGNGSPYYSRVKGKCYSCISILDQEDFNWNLLKNSQQEFLDITCGDNQNCKNQVEQHLQNFLSNPNDHATKNLMNLREDLNNNNDDYSLKLAINCWLGSLYSELDYES